MIKLEDLKIGDKIYEVSRNGIWVSPEAIVKHELFILDCVPSPCEAVWYTGGSENDILRRSDEQYIFRSKQEAIEFSNKLKVSKATELLNSNKFVDRLFECSTSAKRLHKYEELPLFELAIKLYKERLF